jgi:hypothetical protein
MRILLLVGTVFLFLSGTAAAAETPVLVAGAPSVLELGDAPAIAATGDGYAIAWQADTTFDDGTWRFARFDLGGTQLGDVVLLDELPTTFSVDSRLLTTADGFLLLVMVGRGSVHTLPLDPQGEPTGPVQIVAADLMQSMDAASNGGSTVVVTVEFESPGFWFNRSQEVDSDGSVAGPSHRIAAKSIEGDDPLSFVQDVQYSPIVAAGSGFVTAWTELAVGVHLRELGKDGRPRGSQVQLVDESACPTEAMAVAELNGGVQAVVFGAGCDQTDVWLMTRANSGALLGPVPISSDPVDEAPFGRTVLAASGGSRIGVLFMEFLGFQNPERPWRFQEVDENGNPLGPRRDLETELAIEIGNPDMVQDPATGRYVIAWAGPGPQGQGVYWVALDPAP